MPLFFRRHWATLTLLLILVVAGWMRLNGRNFDDNTGFHPDERHVVDITLGNVNLPEGTTLNTLLDAWHSPLNPRTITSTGQSNAFVYGALPVYIVKATAWAGSKVAEGLRNANISTIPGGQIIPSWDGHIADPLYYLSYDGLQKTGRTMSALFDLFTVFLVFLIGRRLYGRNAGLLAAAFSAFAVTQIQIAHFYIVEPYLVTFMTATLYFSVVLLQRPGFWPALGAGLCLGFALACKVSVAPLALVIVAAIVLRAVYRRHTRALGPDVDVDDPLDLRPAGREERQRTLGRALRGGLGLLLVAAVASIVAFFIGDPYAFLQWNQPLTLDSFHFGNGLRAFAEGLNNEYLRQLLQEADNQGGVADVPFTRQYIGTVPVFYHLQQTVQWGMGYASGLVALAALVWAFWRIRWGRPKEILLLSGSLAYFATIATLEAKWMRYMLPLVPYLCVLAGGLLAAGLAWSRRAGVVERVDEWARAASVRTVAHRESWASQVRRWSFPLITAVAVLGSLAWAVAFQSIYSQTFTSVEAGNWLALNAPQSAVLGQETWDEGVRGLDLAGAPPHDWGHTDFQIYDDRPSPVEFEYLKGLLAQTDYIILNSNRMYKTIPKLPWRYPVQAKYYQLLFQGKLGFKLVHISQVNPSIFGITLDDQGADESFTVYDHPEVLIFQKVSDVSDDELHTLFGKALDQPSLPIRHGTNLYPKSLVLPEPVGQAPAVDDYMWNALAQNQWVGLLLWLLAVEVFGLLAWPVVALVCRALPDRGYPLAKITGLLIVGWLTWMAASLHLAPFTVWSILGATAILGLLGLWAWRTLKGELGSFARGRRWLILSWEGLFLVAFVFFVLIRMLDPDLWQPWNGGEKPMEFAFINGILRSAWMPPIDSFFANGIINYYYYGHFLVATLIKLVGLDPAVGFNLAIATLYGFVVLGAASVVYNCVALVQRARGWRSPASRTAFGFGVVASLLLVGIGNLQGALQFLAINFHDQATTLLPLLGRLGLISESLATQLAGSIPSQFDFWSASRVIEGNATTINEFPYWTFLFADLHPHLIGLAFTILAAALALNLLLGAWRWTALRPVDQAVLDAGTPPTLPLNRPVGRMLGRMVLGAWGAGPVDALLRFGLGAMALGSLAAINTWDFPTYAGLAGGALIVAFVLVWRAVKVRTWLLGVGLFVGAVVGAAAVALMGIVLYAPFFLNFNAGAVGGIKFLDESIPWMRRTTMGEFLTVWGLFIFIALSYLIVRLLRFPWREAVSDWGRWFGVLTGPARRVAVLAGGAAAGGNAVTYPHPLSPASLPTEGAYSALLPPTNGHTALEPVAADEAAFASVPANGHVALEPAAGDEALSPFMPANGHATLAAAAADEAVAAPLPAGAALSFMPGAEPVDINPGDAELEPGLHPALAGYAPELGTTNGAEDGADDYVTGDAGSLGLTLDDDEVRQHTARHSRVPTTQAYTEHEILTGDGQETGDENGHQAALDDYDTEQATPGRRSVPLEDTDGEPTYTVRVPPSAFQSEPDHPAPTPADAVASAAETAPDAPLAPTLDLAAAQAAPHASAAADSDAPLAMQSPDDTVTLDALPVAEAGDSSPAWADTMQAPVDSEMVDSYPAAGESDNNALWADSIPPATEGALLNEQPVADDADVDGAVVDAALPVVADMQASPEADDAALPGPIHVEAEHEDVLPLAAEADIAVDAASEPVAADGSPDSELTWLPEEDVTPAAAVVARPVVPGRGILPAGIGLLLLGVTGVATLILIVQHQGLLALLTLLIGGLVATHLGSVRAPGTLFGGMMLVLALAVAMGVEIVYLSDFLDGGDAFRMNTVFKFYMQVWVLFAMGSAVALYILLGPRCRAATLVPALAGPDAAPASVPVAPDETMPLVARLAAPEALAPAPDAVPDEPEDDPLGWLVPPASSPFAPVPQRPAGLDEASLASAEPAPWVEAADNLVDAPADGAESVAWTEGPADLADGEPAAWTEAGDSGAEPPGAAEPATWTEGPADPVAPESTPVAPPSEAQMMPALQPDTIADAPPVPGLGDYSNQELLAPAPDSAPVVEPTAEMPTAASLEAEAIAGTPEAPTTESMPNTEEAAQPPPQGRPGLGPGTYDPESLNVPDPPADQPADATAADAATADATAAAASVSSADASGSPAGNEPAPATEPEALPVWDDAEGAALADAVEEQASVAHEPGEPQVVGYEPVPPDAPGEPGMPDSTPVAESGTAAAGPLDASAFPAATASPLYSPLLDGEDAATVDAMTTPLPAADDGAEEAPPELIRHATPLPVRRMVIGEDSPARPLDDVPAPRPDTSAPVSDAPALVPAAPPSNILKPVAEVAFGAGRTLWWILFVVLLLGSFVFTVAGTKARVENRFPDTTQWPAFGTLNGMDWMDKAKYNLCFDNNQTCGDVFFRFEKEALLWMRDNIHGTPVVADAPVDYYRGSGGMVATYTGLPILLGVQHEGEQRYDWQVGERDGDTREFFTTADTERARIMIVKYDIQYIYIGQVARLAYKNNDGATSKFDDMVQAGLLDVAHKNEAVTIYHVKPQTTQAGQGLTPGQPRPSPTPKPTPTEPPVGSDPQLIALEQAVQASPTDTDARSKLADYYRQHKVFSKAVEQYQAILALDSKNVAVYQMMGDTYQEAGDADKALAAWEEAVKEVPDNPDAHNKVGLAYRDRGRYDDAVREFQATVKLNPQFVEASFHLGEVYETLQQKDNAIKAYQDVLTNGKDSSWAQDAQKRINALK